MIPKEASAFLKANITKSFCFDGDICEVLFIYDPESGKHFGEYPDFEETPRYTPLGKPWVTAMRDGCPHGVSKYTERSRCLDCGSCIYFKQEHPGDLIGVCENERTHLPVPSFTPQNQTAEECF